MKSSVRTFGNLIGWQACSIMLTLTGYCSARLAQLGVHAPTAQSVLAYALLSLHHVPLYCRRHRANSDVVDDAPHASRGLAHWQWLLVALADVEANFLLVFAYQFTDMTSVALLDAFAVPMVMLLSRALFGTRYTVRQLIAAAICIGGLALLLFDDVARSQDATPAAGSGDEGSGLDDSCTDGAEGLSPHQPLVGDVMVLVGASIYAASNVAQERLVGGSGDRVEYLARLGTFGTIIAATQSLLVEREALNTAVNCIRERASQPEAGEMVGLAAGFAASLTAFYMLVATLLHHGSNATVMNLSLLTADFWSVLVGVALLGERVGYRYAISFVCVVFGLLLYHWSDVRRCPERLTEPLVRRSDSEHTSASDAQIEQIVGAAARECGGLTADATTLTSRSYQRRDDHSRAGFPLVSTP